MLVVLYAVIHEKHNTMYEMFFVCFWVVLLCSVFVPKKPLKNFKTCLAHSNTVMSQHDLCSDHLWSCDITATAIISE